MPEPADPATPKDHGGAGASGPAFFVPHCHYDNRGDDLDHDGARPDIISTSRRVALRFRPSDRLDIDPRAKP